MKPKSVIAWGIKDYKGKIISTSFNKKWINRLKDHTDTIVKVRITEVKP